MGPTLNFQHAQVLEDGNNEREGEASELLTGW